MTNLYGWSLSQSLPHSSFQWEAFGKEEVLELVKNYDHDSSEFGYLMEVDLDIDESLHAYFQDFPPIISKTEITEDHLSPWSKLLLNNQKHKTTVKLAPTLYNKRKYITHIANLQLFMELGIQLKAVHRVLSFKQSPWLSSYIEFCSKKRSESMDSFGRNFWKLMINSLFGEYIFLLCYSIGSSTVLKFNSFANLRTAFTAYNRYVIFQSYIVNLSNFNA